MNLFVVSNNESLIKVLSQNKDFNLIGCCKNKNEIKIEMNNINKKIDILLVHEKGTIGRGSTANILINIKKEEPLIRIIYLRGIIDLTNLIEVNEVISLIETGIYDIYLDNKIDVQILNSLLTTPKQRADVESIYEYREKLTIKDEPLEETEIKAITNPDIEKNNIIAINSSKPGSGKSFVSTNLATLIAKYGRVKNNLEPPSVLLLEGDIQTLSVKNLLNFTINDAYSLGKVLSKISSIVSDRGEMSSDVNAIRNVNNFIKQSCIQHNEIKNLYGLVDSSNSLMFEDDINPYQYFYLLEVLSSMFDIVIVDCNSSIEHKTTGPIFQLCKQCFMVINDDYDSQRINQRHKEEYLKLNILNKMKYIVNRYDFSNKNNENLEKIFDIAGYLPALDNNVALNAIYNKKPVVLDKTFKTFKCRLEFTKIADQIYPMDNIKELKEELEDIKRGK